MHALCRSSQGLVDILKKTTLAFNFESANVAAALSFVKKNIFSFSFDRPSAPNQLLFILNSWSSTDSQVSQSEVLTPHINLLLFFHMKICIIQEN